MRAWLLAFIAAVAFACAASPAQADVTEIFRTNNAFQQLVESGFVTESASVTVGSTITCNQSAANGSQLTTAVAAASNGQIVCLTASTGYGIFTGTNKAITIMPVEGVTPTMTLEMSNGDANFTIDGGYETWSDTTGLTITSATFTGNPGPQDITLRDNNFTDTGPTGAGVIFIDGPVLSDLQIDHNVFYGVSVGTEAAIRDDSANSGVTIKNNLFRDLEADGVKMNGSGPMTVINNKFLRILDPDITVHSDAIQFNSGDNSTVRGNLIDTCNQAITGFDGMSLGLIEHNIVKNCTGHWITTMYDQPASTVRWNTVVDSGGVINCGNNTKYAGGNISDTNIYNNISVGGIALQGEAPSPCTPTRNDHNMCASACGASNFTGSPTFVATNSVSKFDDYRLAAGSAGKTGASDGTEVGACGGGYDCTTGGPPREG